MENKSLFPTFEKMYRRIPASFFEPCAVVLLELLMALLLIEQTTVLFWEIRTYEYLFFAVGGLLVLFSLLYIGFRLYKKIRYDSPQLLVTDIAFLLFLVWCGLSTVFSEKPFYSFVGSRYRKEGFVTYLIYAAVIIVARTVQSARHQKILLWTLGGTGSILAIFTFLQSEKPLQWLLSIGDLLPGRIWLDGYMSVFSNLNHLAYFLTLVVLGLAGLFLLAKSPGEKWTALVLFVFTSVVLVRNNTFGCILSVAFALVFLVFIMFLYDKRFFKQVGFLLALYVLAVLITPRFNATLSGDFQEIYDALNNSSETITNASVRLLMWRESLEHIAQSPLFGVGLEGGDVIHFAAGIGNDRPHNEYIQYALFTGIPGAIAYLTALGSLFVCCMRNLTKLPTETLILGTMVVGYCASAFVGNSMYYTTVYFAMLLGLVMGSVKNIDRVHPVQLK